jgi:hypothetical protein
MPETGDFWAVERARKAIEPALQITSDSALDALRAFVIDSDEKEAFAVKLAQEIKQNWASIEEQRKKITTPLLEAKRQTDAVFKPALDALAEEERLLKDKLAAYMQMKEQRNVAALAEAKQAPTVQDAQQAIARVAPVATPQGMSVRHVWKFEITDESIVPRELCSPDPKKIGAAFQVVNGQPVPVPGVRWYQDTSVSVRK